MPDPLSAVERHGPAEVRLRAADGAERVGGHPELLIVPGLQLERELTEGTCPVLGVPIAEANVVATTEAGWGVVTTEVLPMAMALPGDCRVFPLGGDSLVCTT
jgi:hypothetical protein